ncbi:MAG: glycosyltransferase family 2 protein [Prolixibacteraceae bacterium]|nr:glycosyltransferase family 2 protein [Prolixibacteraceae bacterium]
MEGNRINSLPLVSVHMITYKHEQYIRQAIEGVLMQVTDFGYDLIIADDCSPDKTPEIVNEIIRTHPKGSCIKYYRHSENLGMTKNGLFAFSKCTGKYIALCEGDDYWTDQMKKYKSLQKQIQFQDTVKWKTAIVDGGVKVVDERGVPLVPPKRISGIFEKRINQQ